jgi:hypothetical protein
MVIPQADLVVLCTSDWKQPEYPQRFRLVEDFLAPAIASNQYEREDHTAVNTRLRRANLPVCARLPANVVMHEQSEQSTFTRCVNLKHIRVPPVDDLNAVSAVNSLTVSQRRADVGLKVEESNPRESAALKH